MEVRAWELGHLAAGEALEVNQRVTIIKTFAKLLYRISALIPNHKQLSMSTKLC
jgi:hypothetical protein